MATSETYDIVHDHYSRLARETTHGYNDQSRKAALAFGYSVDELSTIPEGSNLGISCSNSIALAGLKEASFFLFSVQLLSRWNFSEFGKILAS
jgi:arsenite methyltransferase